MNKQRIAPIALLLVIVLGVSIWFLAQPRAGTHQVSGTIETDEVRVASRYGGRVERIHFDEGDALEPGSVIVELEAGELRARREHAAALLDELQRGPRPAEMAAASNDWQALVAQLEFARAEEKRAQELFDQKTVSATERDLATSRAHALERSVAAARQRYDLLVEGTRPERIEQARARLAEMDAQWREMQIASPTNAFLEVLHVKVGDVLPPNREVATLILPQRLWVRVYVPEPWLGHIQLGQTVKLRVDSFPDKEFEGTVEQINRQAEFTPRNVQTVGERVKQVFGVKVRLPADTDTLRPGISADVYFPNVPPPPR